MDIREKLVELFHEHNSHYVVFCDDCFKDTPEEFNSRMYGLADHLLANGVTVQEWIPVTERLPEKGEGTVLVCGSRGGIYTAYLERGNKYPKWHKLNSKNHYCDPTHWMPLPSTEGLHD